MSIFIPKERGDIYFYINSIGIIIVTDYNKSTEDEHRIKSGNCYRTEQEAVRAREKSCATRELEVLADELNAGVEINWGDLEQEKWYIEYNYSLGCFETYENGGHWKGLSIYCLSDKFLEVALEKLGVEKLKLILDVKEV